ncbi:MAG: hypothetical protein ABL888_08945 [Pirellulaceae bacterium]
MSKLLLLDDSPARGAWNMALDQALLECVDETGWSILRFYRWSPATLSLGYFQSYNEREQHPLSRELDVVRRASGGGAIVHDRELTYSLVVPITSRWSQANRELYDLVHKSIVEYLAGQGVTATLFDSSPNHSSRENPLLCFERRADGDILIGNHKIGGSAQRRSKNSLLQHGSILLERSLFAVELPGIADLTGVAIDDRLLSGALQGLISSKMAAELVPFEIPSQWIDLARRIETERFGASTWTHNR